MKFEMNDTEKKDSLEKKEELIGIPNWSLFDIIEAVDGKLENPPEEELFITGVHHDSRMMEAGSLFVPIIAERNGHDFVASAFEAGAVASFWSEELRGAPKDIPLIVVEDTLEALKEFARWYLEKIQPKVVGITGSNGKTTTKDMTAKVLEAKYATHKTAGNFNNEIGLPLTILTMPDTTEIIVLEMGTDQPGGISMLSELATPDVAVVTMIGESHIEAFGTRENLATEKVSICSGLKSDGLFIYPANERLISKHLSKGLRTKSFALDEEADIFAFDIQEEIESTHFTVQTSETDAKMSMMVPVPGSYNVNNALMAILVGLEFGVSLEEAKQQLANLQLTKNRLEWIDGINGIKILNDAYNASPSSMQAVLNYFQTIVTKKDRVIVLGDILELGELAQSLHEGIADAIDLEANQFIFLYGENMKYLYDKLKKETNKEHLYHFSGDKKELIQAIKSKVRTESLVLFKSSNGTDLLAVVDELRANNK